MTPQITQWQQRIVQTPDDPSLYYELGRCYLGIRQPMQAAQAFKQALLLAPDHPQILMQLGNCASQQGQWQQAADYFRQSLAQDQTQADVHFNLANSLRELGQPSAAIHHYQQALSLNPDDADTHNNLGNAYRMAGQLDLACQAYAQALAIQPNMLHAKVHWIHQKQHMADWQGLDVMVQEVRAALASTHQGQIPPFAFLAMPGTTDAEQTRCASLWAQQRFGSITPMPTPAARQKNTPIRIAYLSSDFRRHPLAYLVTEVIASHDRQQFEVFLYSQAPLEDSQEQQAFRQAADHWQCIDQLTDQQVAEQMRAMQMDVLVDLTGYTQNSRSGIVAWRPARCHVNWLGYPGSMGSVHGRPLFDAIVVDETLHMPHLAEQALRLPCYQPNNAQRPQSDAGTRAEHGLPATGIVFCNFNQSFKITADIFALWMQLLARCPGSVLWLLDSNRWAVDNLRHAAAVAGVACDRLIFAPRTDIAHHLARQQHADLMLDTLPYNAHTTASDALWQGVPILTMCGETFSARVTASLLQRMQLEQLICHSSEQYVQQAQWLAEHPADLQDLRKQILANRDRLFNPQAFCRTLEQSYRSLLVTDSV